jgi:hypothetical protein
MTERLETCSAMRFPTPGGSVADRTGGGDHFQVTLASTRFDGLCWSSSTGCLRRPPAPLADGTIHELRIRRGAG